MSDTVSTCSSKHTSLTLTIYFNITLEETCLSIECNGLEKCLVCLFFLSLKVLDHIKKHNLQQHISHKAKEYAKYRKEEHATEIEKLKKSLDFSTCTMPCHFVLEG
jgi:hypothetical protein